MTWHVRGRGSTAKVNQRRKLPLQIAFVRLPSVADKCGDGNLRQQIGARSMSLSPCTAGGSVAVHGALFYIM